ncbi:MAG: DUF3237 domain-containing protein [Chloroflexota bacterium]|nr:MAG: DUF3237 domain-containing protein [Chloroflexota bacterium]
MEDLKTEFLSDVAVNVDWKEIMDLGATPRGNRQITYIKGGTFKGPKVKGVVLPGGGDWFIRRPDGVIEMDVRAAVRTDDNHLIYTYIRGINDMTLEVALKLINGEVVDASKYYFRVTPVFETASEKYGWLNRIVAVGIGRLTPAGVTYKMYTIL